LTGACGVAGLPAGCSGVGGLGSGLRSLMLPISKEKRFKLNSARPVLGAYSWKCLVYLDGQIREPNPFRRRRFGDNPSIGINFPNVGWISNPSISKATRISIRPSLKVQP